ncbi:MULTISPECIES: hypothetical protein [unclassified Rathayibacter]|uniref:hypothetical protein n=1 Tax=unclassified Rathayibacter TaxID=2609250 RepID=UPI000CE8C67F|nr:MULTISPECIES: hypothetical protein [unclassified Rathayibacter]PPI40776.1 hypothetical protein C5D50_04375 [Rathayibacter sp. RFBD1]PPI60778.1 hypothetical protein C5D38_04110 [Rathayibacter sp. TRS19]
MTAAPVRAGDRLLLDTPLTAVAGLTWATVELVEHHSAPGSFPWSTGGSFPFRVGYRIDRPAPGVEAVRGVVWLAADGTDATGAVRAVDRVVRPGAAARTGDR